MPDLPAGEHAPGPRPPSERVRVTGPPRRVARRSTGAEQIDAGTAVGEVYLRSLLAEQLRLGLAVVATLALTLGSLPVVFYLAPGLADVRVLGVPLAWAVLAGAVYPFLFVLGWVHVRRSEANERDFAQLVAREEPPSGAGA
ncbi:hypothetical protein QE364_003753 [Nocardioides zeae]|uniref:Uncharacterized protein n=1 Tax=Nocardioides zeae TaxID=1457234 RepID=A0ACC6IMY2_9ACTN|nr:hypothetical protein [Nocardioides zeae]MDR6174754.1 hypothetical protein [Nocardioides zeae]MDR6212022.1 hypothetical protein [Nocardioides zeae]